MPKSESRRTSRSMSAASSSSNKKPGRHCCIETCKSDSSREEDAGVTFHRIPPQANIRPQWIEVCRLTDDKKNQKVFYVCSRHFLRADFCNYKGRKYLLRQGVLPSVFPWDKSKLEAIKAEVAIKKEVDTEEYERPSKKIKVDENIVPDIEIKTEPEDEPMPLEQLQLDSENKASEECQSSAEPKLQDELKDEPELEEKIKPEPEKKVVPERKRRSETKVKSKTPLKGNSKAGTKLKAKPETKLSSKTKTKLSPEKLEMDNSKADLKVCLEALEKDSSKVKTKLSLKTSKKDSSKAKTKLSPETLEKDNSKADLKVSLEALDKDSSKVKTKLSPETLEEDNSKEDTKVSLEVLEKDSSKAETKVSPEALEKETLKAETKISPEALERDNSKAEPNINESIKVEDKSDEDNKSETVANLEVKLEFEPLPDQLTSPSSDILPDEDLYAQPDILDPQPDPELKPEHFAPNIKQFDQNLDENSELKNDETASTSVLGINFAINARIEVLDFNDCWYPARIVEIDYGENEVLIHFEKFSSKFDEWICMDSARLRAIQPKKPDIIEKFIEGERCLATWVESRKFPAIIHRVLGEDMYDVLFDDGYMKSMKAQKINKLNPNMQISPLFDPVKGTKQDRRDKKRKLDVAALFGKKPKLGEPGFESLEKSPKHVSPHMSPPTLQLDDPENPYAIKWIDGKPVGVESLVDTHEGKVPSYIIDDPRLPPDFTKHVLQRTTGSMAGKWECIIVGPFNRRFRARSKVRMFMEQYPQYACDESIFDFTVFTKPKSKKSEAKKSDGKKSEGKKSESKKSKPKDSEPKKSESNTSLPVEEVIEPEPIPEPVIETPPPPPPPQEEENSNLLKITMVDEAYKCPIEGCGKNFRRKNLAQMHVKHYHPKFRKFLDRTPKVAELAYARTYGENLDMTPVPVKPSPLRTSLRSSSQKQPGKIGAGDADGKPHSPAPPHSKNKDAEIIKLLNSKPFDNNENENTHPLSAGVSPNMYADMPLTSQDRDDHLKMLASTKPTTGIKTLLPVRPSTDSSDEAQRAQNKRKRDYSESQEFGKGNDQSYPSPTHPTPHPDLSQSSDFMSYLTAETSLSQPPLPPNNIIIEGGEVIKIVQMKQEEIINCTCGFTEEDGLMIQCELCLCWQHAYCNNIERESQVPDKYVCFICQNPARERTSKKYFHDQDWLKLGRLPTGSYHSKDLEVLNARFEKLRKTNDITGGLLELREYVHNMGIKIKIAEAKNHPKLYLWSKPWEKLPLPEKANLKTEIEETKPKLEDDMDLAKSDQPNDAMLLMMLKNEKDALRKFNLNTLMDTPFIPQPEEAIDSADCRLHLLEHIAHGQSLTIERLDDFEKMLDNLEEGMDIEQEDDYPRTRQTIEMLIRDLDALKDFSAKITNAM